MKNRPYEARRLSLTGDRKNNQDRGIVLESGTTTMLAVADGLGGHPRGEVAAQLFVDICESQLRRAEQPLQDPEGFIGECIRRAHHAIIAYGDRQTPPICPRSTSVLAIIQHGKVWWGHVGDSRLYLLREGGILAQTQDHSLVHTLKQSEGADDASKPSRSTITRCLGGLDQPPETSFGDPMTLQVEDTLLLCTDGLWSQIEQDELVGLLSGESLQSGLLNAFEIAAGYPHSDNITAVALRWDPDRVSMSNQNDTSSPPPSEEISSELIDSLARGN